MAISLMAIASVVPADAGLVLDFTGGSSSTVAGFESTRGWEFDVLSAIVVDGLGLCDEGGDGLAGNHAVGLWNSDGSSLLASTLITNASTPVSSASSDGRWLFNGIAPLTLAPGTYVVGEAFLAVDPDEQRVFTSATTIPGVTFVTARMDFGAGSGLNFPGDDISFLNDGIFGPNLRTAAVPTPLSLALLGLGFVGIAAHRRVRRRGR